jgi:Pyruvate/2-oxoacid:ferredoxin oxidoreductase delta subunit
MMDTHRKSLISKSTRNFIAAAKKMKPFNLFLIIHGYVYARWPYLYIGIGKGEHPLAKRFLPIIALFGRLFPSKRARDGVHSLDIASHTIADTYHGKALPLQTARELILIKEPINKPDLEHVVPYTQARAIILEHPDHIVALECPCRAAVEHPCTPIDVCLILEEEDARGHVHHAFFKDAMLGRYYAICNCCSCCCGAMKAHHNHIPMLASSGYVAKIDHDLCLDCGTCHDYCQFSALHFDEQYTAQVDDELCMGCGICVSKCPQEAIELVLDPAKGVPLDVSSLV